MFDTVPYSVAANGDLTINDTDRPPSSAARIAAVFVNTRGQLRAIKQTYVGADGKLQWTFHLVTNGRTTSSSSSPVPTARPTAGSPVDVTAVA